MVTGFAWGWMRIHCHWVHRYLARAVWGRLPHVGLGIVCTVVAGVLPLRPADVVYAAPRPTAAVYAAPRAAPALVVGYITPKIDFFRGGTYLHTPREYSPPTEVPEPTSFAVFLAGLVTAVLLRRWRR